MNEKELFDFVKNEVNKAIKDEVCEVISQTDKVIHVFDDDCEKEFHLYNPRSMNASWLKKKIILTDSAKKCSFVPNINVLANWLIANFDKKYYLNLNHIIFIYDDETDFDELYEKEEFAEMLDGHNFPSENQLGIYWNEYDTVVISIGNILRECEKLESVADSYSINKEMNIGVFVTILHELAHMGYSNPYVPDFDDSEFYSEDDEEECVENIARTAYEKNPAYILVA